jgi:hypothetical protein
MNDGGTDEVDLYFVVSFICIVGSDPVCSRLKSIVSVNNHDTINAITSTEVCSARADSMSHTLSEAKAVVSSLEASGINCNTSLVSIIRTVLRFKGFG